MRDMKKRGLAYILALAMLMTTLVGPIPAFATSTEGGD